MFYTYFDETISKKRVKFTKNDTNWNSRVSKLVYITEDADSEILMASQIDPFKELFSSKEFKAHVESGRKQLKENSSKLVDLTNL